jgi:1-deoxy-D-xylulose-5-phosphate synthase
VTGRARRFDTIRQEGGLMGYPSPDESEHDPVFTAHAGHSISLALGVAMANRALGNRGEAVAIIGDGAMTSGMALEALNHAGGSGTHLVVVLNDNGMSICQNVGAIAGRLADARGQRIPAGDSHALWTCLGFASIGPIDGHDIAAMEAAFTEAKHCDGPVLVHVATIKGKGDPRAVANATAWHDVSAPAAGGDRPVVASWSTFATQAITRAAASDRRVFAITAAMAKGTGLTAFRERFPDRFIDVGIAEQHAVALAAGLARQGARPVVAIYSTFLQRAYDQLIHDVCIQNLPVVFAIDRAGIVGDDGKTQQGVFDYSYMRCIPNLVLMAPKDENELQHMLHTALQHQGPIAVRYPRGAAVGVRLDDQPVNLPIGKAETLRQGNDVSILALGNGVPAAERAAVVLSELGVSTRVVNARFLKPLDRDMVLSAAQHTGRIVTVEENALMGGFGSAVLETLADAGKTTCRVCRLGVPDEFVEHGPQASWRKRYALDPAGIVDAVRTQFPELFVEQLPEGMPSPEYAEAGDVLQSRAR